jgi:hypothetical protein
MGDVVAFVNLHVLNALESCSGAGQVGMFERCNGGRVAFVNLSMVE